MCMANSYRQHCNHLCEKHKFPKGFILFWNHSERGQAWCFGFMFLWQRGAKPSPHQTTLKSYSRFFFFFGTHLFVNKKCNGNREVLGSSQHEICPLLVSQTLLTAPEGLAQVSAVLWEGSGNCDRLCQRSPPHACRDPALTGAASHYRAKINFPAICLLQTGITVVRNVDSLLKIGESVIVWSHSCSPIPFYYFYPQMYVRVYAQVLQSCPTLCDPMNRSTPGLPVHHQLLEFIETHVHRVRDGFSWSGLPFLPPGDLPDPGSEPGSPESPVLQVDYLSLAPPGKCYTQMYIHPWSFVSERTKCCVPDCNCIWFNNDFYVKRGLRRGGPEPLFLKLF